MSSNKHWFLNRWRVWRGVSIPHNPLFKVCMVWYPIVNLNGQIERMNNKMVCARHDDIPGLDTLLLLLLLLCCWVISSSLACVIWTLRQNKRSNLWALLHLLISLPGWLTYSPTIYTVFGLPPASWIRPGSTWVVLAYLHTFTVQSSCVRWTRNQNETTSHERTWTSHFGPCLNSIAVTSHTDPNHTKCRKHLR